jgi:acetylserotonin N-methyltransferase
MAQDITKPDPTPVLELLQAFRWSKTMFAGISLGVFDALARGPMTAAELAGAVGANAGALARLLDACVGLQLLRRDGPTYANTPVADTYLTTSSPDRLTGYLNYSNDVMWKLWSNLEDAVREGTHRWKQAYGWDQPIFDSFFRTEEAKREFLMGMHGFGLISSSHVVTAFDLSRFARLVDLGGATGHLAVAACRRYPHMTAVVFDLPAALPLAREYIDSSLMADRISLAAGDFFKDDLPDGDLMALGRIIHDWNEEKSLKLLRRIHQRLPAGGAVLLAEKILADDRTGPRWAQMQDLNMLTCTEGRERTLPEYESLLKEAGFSEVTGCRTPAPLDAVLGVKR